MRKPPFGLVGVGYWRLSIRSLCLVDGRLSDPRERKKTQKEKEGRIRKNRNAGRMEGGQGRGDCSMRGHGRTDGRELSDGKRVEER